MSFRVRPLAEADIMGIALYIGERNPAAALKWYDGIYRKFRQLGAMPGTGVARDELRDGLRLSAVGRYLILYREDVGGVEIVRVVHGARDLPNLV